MNLNLENSYLNFKCTIFAIENKSINKKLPKNFHLTHYISIELIFQRIFQFQNQLPQIIGDCVFFYSSKKEKIH